MVVTPASIQDRDAAHLLLAAVAAASRRSRSCGLDGCYAGRLVEWAKIVLALTVQIVKRSDTATRFEVLPQRWAVERTFGWLVKHRRLIPRLRDPPRPSRSRGLHRRHPHPHPTAGPRQRACHLSSQIGSETRQSSSSKSVEPRTRPAPTGDRNCPPSRRS
ncbi:transposase [Nocardia sp. NPDC059246]|uniref:transposase n=1 Tax=unclassified Nocardia TaxID=2637762 RepID=UPI0036B05442